MNSRIHHRVLRAALLWLVAVSAAQAEVRLAPLFRSGAVLQREQPLPIWGWAAPGEKVTVRFQGETATATAEADGRWYVQLSPRPAATTPQTLVVQGRNRLQIDDVLVGDVWLCSGQSNMNWPLAQTENAETEIAQAEHPLIRQFKVPRVPAEEPARDVDAKWVACSPKTAGEFTAVGYYFARDLFARTQVPIGLVHSSWGGTVIESWISPGVLQAEPEFAGVMERWRQRLADFPAAEQRYVIARQRWEEQRRAAEEAGQPFRVRAPNAPEGRGSRAQPGSLYNGMIAPLVPAALSGILWYQGESNAGGRAAEYGTLFQRLITDWRVAFQRPELPFYFVQIANYEPPNDPSGQAWAVLREQQTSALTLPATGMAVTIDIGDPKDIHPRNKRDVGERLARFARAQLYGEKLVTTGPRLQQVERRGRALRLTFAEADGLMLRPAETSSFEVAGADGAFYPAAAVVKGQRIELTAAEVREPVEVRYAWANAPVATVFNAAGLPAAPFRATVPRRR